MAGKKRYNIVNNHKVCTICGDNKFVTQFHSNGDGIRGWCKECDVKKRRGKQQKWKDRKNKTKLHDPIKEKARNAVREAVRSGKLKKPKYCPRCAKETEARHLHGHHHSGYKDKLNIKWLCRWCHAREHVA